MLGWLEATLSKRNTFVVAKGKAVIAYSYRSWMSIVLLVLSVAVLLFVILPLAVFPFSAVGLTSYQLQRWVTLGTRVEDRNGAFTLLVLLLLPPVALFTASLLNERRRRRFHWGAVIVSGFVLTMAIVLGFLPLASALTASYVRGNETARIEHSLTAGKLEATMIGLRRASLTALGVTADLSKDMDYGPVVRRHCTLDAGGRGMWFSFFQPINEVDVSARKEAQLAAAAGAFGLKARDSTPQHSYYDGNHANGSLGPQGIDRLMFDMSTIKDPAMGTQEDGVLFEAPTGTRAITGESICISSTSK